MHHQFQIRAFLLLAAAGTLGACTSTAGTVLALNSAPGGGTSPDTLPGAGGASEPGGGGAGLPGSGGNIGPGAGGMTSTGTGGSTGAAGTGAGSGGNRGSGGGTGTGGRTTGSGGSSGSGATVGSGGTPNGSGGAQQGSGGRVGSGGTVGGTSSGGMVGSGGSGSGGMTSSGGSGMVAQPPVGCPDAPASSAKVYYVCDCASGADSDCAAGDDSKDGLSAATAWQSVEKGRKQFGAMNPGDYVEFCQGGSFMISASNDDHWINAKCKADNRCVVASYKAPWASGNEGRPVLHFPANQHAVAFDDSSNADHEEGYVFAGLELAGAGGTTGGAGFFVYNDIDDVLLCDLSIHDFQIGVDLEGSNTPNPGADDHNENIILRDSYISNNNGQGWLGGDTGSIVQTNHFVNNGFARPNFNHNIYISLNSGATDIHNIQVIGNDLYQSTLVSGQCTATSLVVHGGVDTLLIEGNNVHEDMGGAIAGCFGISVGPGDPTAELFSNVTIRGNTVTNVGNNSIGVASCQNCVIENNVIVNLQGFNAQAISAPGLSGMSNDPPDDHITIRNNSIDIDVGEAIGIIQEGTGHIVVNNAIYNQGGGNGGLACFQFDLPNSAYTAVDNNVCFQNGKGDWVAGQGSLSSWSTKTAFDTHSMVVDPKFMSVKSPYSLIPAAGSPLINSGNVANASATDITGKARDSMPDVGAYEQ